MLVLAYIYIIVNFQLRSSIHAGLTERSLYNSFCIEKSAKMVFLGEGLRYLVGTPYECNDRRSTSFGEKNYVDARNVCTRGKEITKKNKKT